MSSYDSLYTQTGDDLSRVATFGQKWGWYQSVFGLANGDITRFKDITKLNVHECLYALEFMKEKNVIETKRIRRNG